MFNLKQCSSQKKTMEIQKILRYHQYHPKNWGGSDPECPICGESLGHSITLLVENEEGGEGEIHADCLPQPH